MSHCAIEFDHAGAAWTADGVSFPTTSVGHITAEDTFVGAESNFIHEVFINGEASLIIKTSGGDSSAMDFGFEQVNKHGIGGGGGTVANEQKTRRSESKDNSLLRWNFQKSSEDEVAKGLTRVSSSGES